MLALIQTAGVIGPGQRTDTRFLELDLEGVPERLAALRITASPPVAWLSNIPADKNVVSEMKPYPIHDP